MIGELQEELAQLRAEREKLTDGLTLAEERMRALDQKLADAEQAWASLKEESAAQQQRIAALETDLESKAEAINAFDRNAARLTSLSRSLHALSHDDLADEDEFVTPESEEARPHSLLEDSVLFSDDDSDSHVETALDIGTGRPTDDSILYELGLDDGHQSARRRIMVALDEDDTEGVEYSLSKPVMTIGRSKTADIRISDIVVSRTHARLKAEAEGTVIEDAGSKNGVQVNERSVERAVLHNGDVVSFGGQHAFRYVELELPAH